MNSMDAWKKFSSFQAGMYVGNYNAYAAGIHNINFGDTIGVAPLPYFEGGNRASPMNLQGFGITKKSKHPQEAWKFLEYLILTKHDNTNKLADYYLTPSKSMSETTGQSSDPIKSIFLDEINYGYSYFYNGGWNEDLTAQFNKLLTTSDKDIPAKLHDLAIKLDQEMNRLKNAEDQTTESSSQ
jgi:ABC-type glycerol-3-phosphate transport system substrate-binding protein